MFNTNLLATLFAFVLAVVSLQGMQAESVCEHYTSQEKQPYRNTPSFEALPPPSSEEVVEEVVEEVEKEVSKLEKAIMRNTGTASFQGLRSLKSKYLGGSDMLRGSLKIQPLVQCEMNYLPVRETDVVKGYFQ